MRIACIGECMVELTHRGDGRVGLSYGGDTLNTAVYMSRLGLDVDYVTALGDDPYSDDMIARWRSEGLGTRFVIRAKDRMPGLYAIRTDANGERSFYYWRDRAPARDLFGFPEFAQLRESLLGVDIIYLSGVTLSLYSPADRADLHGLLDAQRERGGRVMFDTNHRAKCWSNDEEARVAYTEMLRRVDISLPTIEDEATIFGDRDAQACAARHHELGVTEVAVKMGQDGCYVSRDGVTAHVPSPKRLQAKDTTGAGDAFNAAYLAARLNAREPNEAAAFAHSIAGEVILHPGAIIPRDAMPEASP